MFCTISLPFENEEDNPIDYFIFEMISLASNDIILSLYHFLLNIII